MFVELPTFTKLWEENNLTQQELKDLQNEILKDPEKGDLIRNGGGFRKIRF